MMDKTELKEIFKQHSIWIETYGEDGKNANFNGANFIEINFCKFDFSEVEFSGVNFSGGDR